MIDAKIDARPRKKKLVYYNGRQDTMDNALVLEEPISRKVYISYVHYRKN